MVLTTYEYAGRNFGAEQTARFNATICRDYYSAESQVTARYRDVHLRNSRAFAGFVPITAYHTMGGVSTVTKRSWNQVRNNSTEIYLIWLPVRGSVTISQHGQSAIVEPGHLALSYSNEPLCIDTDPDEHREHLSFQVLAPAHLVAKTLSEPRRFCAVPFPTGQGGAHVAKNVLMSLYGEAEHMDRQSAESLALSAMDAIFKAINEQGKEQCQSIGLREEKLRRLLDYVELHFTDGELTTEKVAGACNISTRYLHYLFKGRGTTYHDYLWKARLESAHNQLTDPTLSRRTIAEIAYSTGFKSSAHFSRAFRGQFGCAPKDVREGLRAAATS